MWYMLFHAPEIKIGLEKDVIVNWFVYKEYARDGHDDMWAIIKTRTPQLGADYLNIIGGTNELVLYVIVIVLIVA